MRWAWPVPKSLCHSGEGRNPSPGNAHHAEEKMDAGLRRHDVGRGVNLPEFIVLKGVHGIGYCRV
jgi:hypothetical protein